MGALNVRPVCTEDLAEWRSLWQGYLAFYETSLPDATIKVAFEKLITPGNLVHGLVAEQDGTLLGLVHFLFHEHLWRPEGICYLQDLFVSPNARGSGVGAALIKAVYAEADEAGVPGVYWLTQDFNTTARRLYDQIGVQTPFIRYNRP